MRNPRRESGRLLFVVVVLVALSSGAVYWKRVLDAPEEAFQAGLYAYQRNGFGRAAQDFKEAQRLGHPDAGRYLAELYLEGAGVERNHRKAFELFREAAEAGNPESQLQLARLYRYGRGTDPDLDQAVVWYWSAAKNDLSEAQLELGRLYESGVGVDKDLGEAARWYTAAAQTGMGEAQLAIGLAYHEGRGVAKNREKAAHWLAQAARDADLPEAWFLIARYHENGWGGYVKDLEQAHWSYQQAAAEGQLDALATLQDMGLSGMELSRHDRRRMEKKREEFRADEAEEQARKMTRVGRCEVYSAGEVVVQMRTRMDCLNRGGRFAESSGTDAGSFSMVDPERGWDSQRRQLNRRRAVEARKSRSSGYRTSRESSEPLETDWVSCYSRGSRRPDGGANYSCSTPMRKRREMTTSWCRERGYDSRRMFKHESSAKKWHSGNCW